MVFAISLESTQERKNEKSVKFGSHSVNCSLRVVLKRSGKTRVTTGGVPGQDSFERNLEAVTELIKFNNSISISLELVD